MAFLVAACGAPCATAADAAKPPAPGAISAAPSATVSPASEAAAPPVSAAKPPVGEAAAAPSAPLKIGYVDFSRVWNEYRRRADFDNEYKTLRQELANQDRMRAEEIARYNSQIEKLAMGTPERLDLEEKVKTAAKEEEEFRRKGVEELNAKFISMLNALVAEVLQEIAAIAREGNYDFIIKDQTPDPNVTSRTDAVLQLGERVVLYAKPEYDLTSAVIQRLNDKYAAEQKKKEAAPSAPEPPQTPAKEK
jgi:Skp family chaperone for outer membrane proteins